MAKPNSPQEEILRQRLKKKKKKRGLLIALLVILGIVVLLTVSVFVMFLHYFNRSKDAEPEEENFAEEAEKPAADPVPIPMTLGNTPSSDTEEYIPKTNYFSRN